MTHSIFDAELAGNVLADDDRYRPHAAFGFDVDGTTYDYDLPTITGAQLAFEAGLYPQQRLVQVLQDGSRVTIVGEQTVNLASGAHFKRRPRFKRG